MNDINEIHSETVAEIEASRLRAMQELCDSREHITYLLDLIGRMRAQWIHSWAKDECLSLIEGTIHDPNSYVKAKP